MHLFLDWETYPSPRETFHFLNATLLIQAMDIDPCHFFKGLVIS